MVVDNDAAKFGDGFEQFLEALVPLRGGLEEKHDALMGEPELQVSELPDMFDQSLRIFKFLAIVIGIILVAQLVEQNGDIRLFENNFAHGYKRRFCGFRVFDKGLPGVNIVLLEEDGWNIFCDVAIQAPHTVSGDVGDHVIFERYEIVWMHPEPIVAESAGGRTSLLRRDVLLPVEEWHSPWRRSHDVSLQKAMIFSKDYVGYLARQTVKHLIEQKMIGTTKPFVVNERVSLAMIEELSLEDRINDEVRVILEAFQDDMRKTGASYPEMFKKVKNELARKYKAVL